MGCGPRGALQRLRPPGPVPSPGPCMLSHLRAPQPWAWTPDGVQTLPDGPHPWGPGLARTPRLKARVQGPWTLEVCNFIKKTKT